MHMSAHRTLDLPRPTPVIGFKWPSLLSCRYFQMVHYSTVNNIFTFDRVFNSGFVSCLPDIYCFIFQFP